MALRLSMYGLTLMFVLAGMLSFYAQRLAYFFSDHLSSFDALTYLIFVSVISIVLFIITIMSAFSIYIKRQISQGWPLLIILFGIVIATVMTVWTVTVLAFWIS